jgi:RND family efflux transporter MFP subunit
MNRFLTTGSVLEHALSVHANATPRAAAKMVSNPLATSPFALWRPNSPCCANAALPWMDLGIHESVTYFPDLVTTFGERIFNACWRWKDCRGVVPVFSLLVASVALSLSGCSKEPHASRAKSPPVVTVRVETIEAKPHLVTEEVIGTVRAKIRAAVEAKVSGRITRMAVDLGQPVREGDLIAEIDAQEIKARLDQALVTREQLGQDLKRYTVLLEKQVAAKQEFDVARARFRVADAAVKEAQAMLGYVEVRAPFAGVISRRLADTGDFASPGKPLVEIENPEILRFEADVPEALIDRIRRGEDLAVRIPSIDSEIKGQAAEIAPSADPNSRTFLVRIDLPTVRGLRAGQFGRAAIPVGDALSLRVPASAVVVHGQLEMVFLAENGTARLRLVKTGKRFGDEIEVLSGLAQGERFVSEGASGLSDDQSVSVLQ